MLKTQSILNIYSQTNNRIRPIEIINRLLKQSEITFKEENILSNQ
jgi:hypothetical protein